LQYFAASAIRCSGDETIEIEYCGHNTKYVYGEAIICGSLGYYKIVKFILMHFSLVLNVNIILILYQGTKKRHYSYYYYI
jgi:hypothetical protein